MQDVLDVIAGALHRRASELSEMYAEREKSAETCYPRPFSRINRSLDPRGGLSR